MSKQRKQPAASPAREAKGKAPVKPAAAKKPKPATAAKPKIGRPTLYRVEYCKLIVELGRKGKTKAQMASELDIARSTFDAWMDTHEEFADAWARADTHAKAYLEGLGEKAVFLGPRFNDRAWLAMLRARWPEYRESKELELSGAVGGEPVKLVVSPLEAGL